MHNDIAAYNRAQSKTWKPICTQLAEEIDAGLPKAECKIWHGSPVWFIDGNPVVGYDVLKSCVRLLFWSGQSFKEPGLAPEGSFKAAEARFTDAAQISRKDLKRWLKKAQAIQWDYKNIVRRKGTLVRLRASKNQTAVTAGSVRAYIAALGDARQRKDCTTLCALMQKVAGEKPVMWGPAIIGFGRITMTYATGRVVDCPLISFSARKNAFALYLSGKSGDFERALKRLGKFTRSGSCLYVKSLNDVDMKVLEDLCRIALRNAKR